MKNKIIDGILNKLPEERLNFEWLTLFAWVLENIRHDEKRKQHLETLLNKWNDRELEEVADFDVKLEEMDSHKKEE